MKVTTTIKTTVETVAKYVLDFNKRLLWDKLTDEAETKVVINENNDIAW